MECFSSELNLHLCGFKCLIIKVNKNLSIIGSSYSAQCFYSSIEQFNRFHLTGSIWLMKLFAQGTIMIVSIMLREDNSVALTFRSILKIVALYLVAVTQIFVY